MSAGSSASRTRLGPWTVTVLVDHNSLEAMSHRDFNVRHRLRSLWVPQRVDISLQSSVGRSRTAIWCVKLLEMVYGLSVVLYSVHAPGLGRAAYGAVLSRYRENYLVPEAGADVRIP